MSKINDKHPYIYMASDISGFLTGIGILFGALLFIYQLLYNDNLIYLSGSVGENFTLPLIKLSFFFFTVISWGVYIYIKKINDIKLNKKDFLIILLMIIFLLSFFNIYKANKNIILFSVIVCLFFSFFYELYSLSSIDFLGNILVCLFFISIVCIGFIVIIWSPIQFIEISLINKNKFSVSEYLINNGYIFMKVDAKRYLIPLSTVKTITIRRNNNTTDVIKIGEF